MRCNCKLRSQSRDTSELGSWHQSKVQTVTFSPSLRLRIPVCGHAKLKPLLEEARVSQVSTADHVFAVLSELFSQGLPKSPEDD
jgi:hypothetical protein